MDKKFIVEILGKGFTLTQQGNGDEAAARDYLSDLYQGCEIRVRRTGGPVDVESGP